MRRGFPHVPSERYADELICRSRVEAQWFMDAMQERFASYGLKLHPEKTQVVYRMDSNRRGQLPQIQFTFLGY